MRHLQIVCCHCDPNPVTSIHYTLSKHLLHKGEICLFIVIIIQLNNSVGVGKDSVNCARNSDEQIYLSYVCLLGLQKYHL